MSLASVADNAERQWRLRLAGWHVFSGSDSDRRRYGVTSLGRAAKKADKSATLKSASFLFVLRAKGETHSRCPIASLTTLNSREYGRGTEMCKSISFLTRVSAMILATGLGFIAASVTTATAQDKVRIGVGVDPSFTTWWVAKDRGFFTKHNIDAEITQFTGGPDLADATMAGEMDFGSSGTATWMPRFVRSDALLIIGTMATSTDNFKMAALTSIKSLEDLKGKRVGTVAGSTIDYLWALVAKKLGIPESGLNITPVTPPELPAALDRGDVQAFFSWEPWPSKSVEISGKNKVHILASSGDVGYFQNFVVVGNKKFIQAKPDVTVRVLAAMRDASDYMAREHAETIKVTAARNKMTPQMAEYIFSLYKFEIGLSDKVAEGAKVEEAWMRGKERLKGNPIDWTKVIDRTYYDRAMAKK
jgi:NitT/TauT family transport system substrate-binding protein